MGTLSTVALLETLRTRLLTFPSPAAPGTRKLSDILSDRLYFGAPPADCAYPYGLLRWNGRNAGAYRGVRMKGSLELVIVQRPANATEAKLAEEAADLAQGALLQFSEGDTAAATSGGILVVEGSRETLPRPVDPVDQQTYTIQLVWDVVVWPKFLTQYTS